ncbi:MAG: hypothetical protein FK732_06430 [Asgard group archaeon]|nr:hypothetical protein [Asgard group archaeon]
MSKHKEVMKVTPRNNISVKETQEQKNEKSDEINDLVNSPDFIEFAQTISNTIDDETTFNEILSSQVILKNALAILKKLKKESMQK